MARNAAQVSTISILNGDDQEENNNLFTLQFCFVYLLPLRAIRAHAHKIPNEFEIP